MSGNTGKMTREALRLRGPRFVLAREAGALLIFSEDSPPFTMEKPPSGFVLAKSYSLSYLKKVAKGNQ